MSGRWRGLGGKPGGGFTVIELLVVVVIVAVLLALGLPTYQQQLRKTRRALARAELMEVRARQEQYFIDHKQYATALTDLGYPGSPYAIDARGNDSSAAAPGRVYLIELSTVSGDFTLSAVPQLGQSRDRLCGRLSLTGIGLRAATGPGGLAQCW